MAAPTYITIIKGMLRVALDVADLAAYDCQVVSAALVANANLQTLPATFCSPEAQVPAATGYQLDLNFLQDWTDPAGISWFSFDNDTAQVAWELTLETDEVVPIDAIMHGDARVVAMSFGGDAGTPLQAAVTWPVIGKPAKGAYPASLAASAAVDDTVQADSDDLAPAAAGA